MSAKKPPPLNDLEREAEQAEVDELATMTSTDLVDHLRAAGADPDALRTEGAAWIEGLMSNRDRLMWQNAAAEGLAREQARVDQRRGSYANVPRDELLARIARARVDPRFTQPVAVMLRNQRTDEATDEELRALLEDIEALAEEQD